MLQYFVWMSCLALWWFQCGTAFSQGRNFYGFSNIMHGHARIGMAKQAAYPPDDYYADTRGGYMEIFLAKGQCSDKYRFTWKFERDISKLEPNELYPVLLEAERTEGNCPQNEAWSEVLGSEEKCQLCQDLNLASSSYAIAVKPRGKERVYAVPEHYNKISEFDINVSRVDEEEARVFLSFSCTTNPSPRQNFDYQVVYQFRRNYQPETGSIGFDCQMLYGIGTNLAFLETAAADTMPWDSLSGFVDGALGFVRASNCLDPAFMEDLRERMSASSCSFDFLQEIRAYREELPALIPRDCIE